MNKLQEFISKLEFGFLNGLPQVKELAALDRLFPVLVRCGACRFTCGAQYYEHLQNCISAGGDYVRDVSIPIGGDARAAAWVPECPVTPAAMVREAFVAPRPSAAPRGWDCIPAFREQDCGGVFDGRGVVSDADPGL